MCDEASCYITPWCNLRTISTVHNIAHVHSAYVAQDGKGENFRLILMHIARRVLKKNGLNNVILGFVAGEGVVSKRGTR